MRKLTHKITFSLVCLLLLISASNSLTPIVNLKREDSPNSSPEAGDNPRFPRGVGQAVSEITQIISWSIYGPHEKLKVETTKKDKPTLTKHIVQITPDVKPPKGYYIPKFVDYVAYYESSSNLVEGYCLMEPVFKDSNPEIDAVSNLPEDNNFISMIDVKGKPVLVRHNMIVKNGHVEAYLTVEMLGKKMVILDCFMSEAGYNSVKGQISKDATSFIEYYYLLLNMH